MSRRLRILSDSEGSEDETVRNVNSLRTRVSSEDESSDNGEANSPQRRETNPILSRSGSENERDERNRESGDEEGNRSNHSNDERDHNSASDNEAGDNGPAPNDENKDDPDKKDDPTKKKRVLAKREVLNSARLKGPRGVHTIEKLFEGFKYKGKGHEKEDLDRVMKRLEYWAFRLFPKLDFDDFIDKVESLGNKKDLLPFLKKYRFGMITADDEIRPDIAEEEQEDRNEANDRTEETRQNELLAQIQQQNEQFDALFADEF